LKWLQQNITNNLTKGSNLIQVGTAPCFMLTDQADCILDTIFVIHLLTAMWYICHSPSNISAEDFSSDALFYMGCKWTSG